MAHELGGDVDKAALGEYGKTEAVVDDATGILDGSPSLQTTWMSHGVAVNKAPAGFEVTAHTEGAPVAAMEDPHASSTACSGILRSSTRRWDRI